MIANLVSNGAEDLGVGQYTVHVRSCFKILKVQKSYFQQISLDHSTGIKFLKSAVIISLIDTFLSLMGIFDHKLVNFLRPKDF
jgi:hypothetical protein